MDLPPPQIVCIAQAVYHEARGESELGQRGVAHVILNRSKKLKKSPCEVIHEPGQFQITFQRKYKGKAWNKAWQVANYPGKDPTGGALYFKSTRSPAVWRPRLKLTTTIEGHDFYK